MWQLITGFLTGTTLGVALPWILLGARGVCSDLGLTRRVMVFFSLLPAYATALCSGALVALISEQFEIWLAGGSVLAGLAIVVIFYRNRSEQEPGRTVRAYALGFGTPFVLLAVFGAGLVAL